LLQSALDYITTNKTGRTDIWLLSDLQQTDWDAAGGRWETLRGAFATLQGVRFHLLTYPQAAPDDLAVTVDRVTRRETGEKAELLFDLRVTRAGGDPQPVEVPVRFVINGAATTLQATLKENQLALQGHAIPIDKATKRGWGRVELPADAASANNVFHFVFDEPAVLRSVIVSDDPAEAAPLVAALSAAADPTRRYAASVLSPQRAAENPWDETALVIWHAAIPQVEDPLGQQLKSHAAAGRAILFLPPESPGGAEFAGLRWGQWESPAAEKPQTVEWWRNDTGLLANTRNGTALQSGHWRSRGGVRLPATVCRSHASPNATRCSYARHLPRPRMSIFSAPCRARRRAWLATAWSFSRCFIAHSMKAQRLWGKRSNASLPLPLWKVIHPNGVPPIRVRSDLFREPAAPRGRGHAG
jgi:hypothetical protein